MFLSFFYTLRARGVQVTPTEWLTLMQALSQGMARSDLVRFYHLSRAICVKSETLYDAFDQAWLETFGAVEAPATVSDAIHRWLQDPVLPPLLDEEALALLQEMDLDTLRREFEQRLQEQQGRHDGGNRWIGTGGTSPFGHGGVHPGGLRVGGEGRGGMAAWIAARRAFAGYRTDIVLDTRQMGVGLKRLRQHAREGQLLELDMDATIRATARNAGDISVVQRPQRRSDLKVLLLMDAGGSMSRHAGRVGRLFSAASRASHFKDFKAFYFHNCVYDHVFSDMTRWHGVQVEHLLRTLDERYRLILVGDACMAPSELLQRWGASDWNHRNEVPGVRWLQRLDDYFQRAVWLNPMPLPYWAHPTVERIADVFPMFELTLDGLEQAMRHLSGQKIDPPEIPEERVHPSWRHPFSW